MTTQEVYNELALYDFVELCVIGGDYAKKNKENKYSILFYELMDGETGDFIELRKTVARLISSVLNSK